MLDRDRLIHSLKTAFACLIGYTLVQVSHLSVQAGQWLIITILVVMCNQVNVGGVIQKSYLRFLGTFSGSLLAALALQIFKTDPIVIGGVIVLVGTLFSYIATAQKPYSDAATLGAVTAIIILVGQHPSALVAFERFLEISMGILIAGLVSQFIFPIHARNYLHHDEATTIHNLREFYQATLLSDPHQKDPTHYMALDETIIKGLIAQRKLSVEAEKEPFGVAFNLNYFTQYLWCTKEILRSMSYMFKTYQHSIECKKIFSSPEISQHFHIPITVAFEQIAQGLDRKNLKVDQVYLPTTDIIKEKIAQTSFENSDLVCANTFLFCADSLVCHLKKMCYLIVELNET